MDCTYIALVQHLMLYVFSSIIICYHHLIMGKLTLLLTLREYDRDLRWDLINFLINYFFASRFILHFLYSHHWRMAKTNLHANVFSHCHFFLFILKRVNTFCSYLFFCFLFPYINIADCFSIACFTWIWARNSAKNTQLQTSH